jgi:hypothetical protein
LPFSYFVPTGLKKEAVPFSTNISSLRDFRTNG